MKKLLPIVVLIAAFAAACAGEPQAPPSAPLPAVGVTSPDFYRLDRDHDGRISPREARGDAALKTKWDVLDVDGDGKISQTEFARFEVKTYEPPELPGTR